MIPNIISNIILIVAIRKIVDILVMGMEKDEDAVERMNDRPKLNSIKTIEIAIQKFVIELFLTSRRILNKFIEIAKSTSTKSARTSAKLTANPISNMYETFMASGNAEEITPKNIQLFICFLKSGKRSFC